VFTKEEKTFSMKLLAKKREFKRKEESPRKSVSVSRGKRSPEGAARQGREPDFHRGLLGMEKTG